MNGNPDPRTGIFPKRPDLRGGRAGRGVPECTPSQTRPFPTDGCEMSLAVFTPNVWTGRSGKIDPVSHVGGAAMSMTMNRSRRMNRCGQRSYWRRRFGRKFSSDIGMMYQKGPRVLPEDHFKRFAAGAIFPDPRRKNRRKMQGG